MIEMLRKVSPAITARDIAEWNVEPSGWASGNLNAAVNDPRLFLPLVRLHLYRFTGRELADRLVVQQEYLRIAHKLATQVDETPTQFVARSDGQIDLHRTEIDTVAPTLANQLHLVCHYLGSPRTDGLHVGLYAPCKRLLALATLSGFDLAHLSGVLPFGLAPANVLVLSRIVSSVACPPNTLSYFIGRLTRWLADERRDVRMVTTYLDPNVGFRGALYRSVNWVILAREMKRRYLYFNGDYKTDRYMIREHGTSDYQLLRHKLGDRVAESKWQLQPLVIYAHFLQPDERRHAPSDFNQEVSPRSG